MSDSLVHERKVEFLYEKACRWAMDMLSSGVIRLKDVPRDLRVSCSHIYVTALRVSRAVSCKWFVQDLRLLYLDLLTLDRDTLEWRELMDTFEIELRMHSYKGEKEYVDFEENLREDILRELYRLRDATQENLRRQFENRKIVQRKSSPEQPSSV